MNKPDIQSEFATKSGDRHYHYNINLQLSDPAAVEKAEARIAQLESAYNAMDVTMAEAIDESNRLVKTIQTLQGKLNRIDEEVRAMILGMASPMIVDHIDKPAADLIEKCLAVLLELTEGP